MTQPPSAPAPALRAPRAAAVAGILFSVLLITSLLLVRRAVPADPQEAGAWLSTRAGSVALAMNPLPLSGIAFLWFIGVLRDRLGRHEDRLFATVFLGSGLLFLAMLFVAGAMAGSILLVYSANPQAMAGSATFGLARAIVYETANTYAVRMAAVFVVVTSTLALRTRFLSRWAALLGYGVALALLFSGRYVEWILVAFPLWVLLVSGHILWDNLRAERAPAGTGPGPR